MPSVSVAVAPNALKAVLNSLEEKRVDGLVLCSSRLGDEELRTFFHRFPAAVLVNRKLDGSAIGAVLVDDESGGRMVTRHLVQAGHRAIGFLVGPKVSHSGKQRFKGYQSALGAAGIGFNPDWVRHCAPVVGEGQGAARKLLTDHPEITALFCFNDLVAVGALRACRQLGRRVPDDLAVAGYDDIRLSELVTPPLTTCRVPRSELGKRAVTLLLNQLNDNPEGAKSITLRPQLVVRASAP